MRDRLVIIDAVKELMKVEGNTRERVVEMVMESHKVHRGTIYAYLSDESSIRLNKPEARVLKIRDQSYIKKPPSRPTTSVTLKTIELCAEYFHDHGNNRFIFFIQNYRNLFHPVSQLKSRQPKNFYQEKNVTFLRCGLGWRCGLGSGSADLGNEKK